jgi:Common central domain of tyrosinase
MRPRKNVANMSVAERAAFADAVIAVHQEPSQRGLANRYDDYTRIHTDAMNVNPSWGHGGSAFTAWHRVLLAKFEAELRQVDDTIRIPYWDWTVDRTATSPPWLADLLGSDGGQTNPPGSQSGEVVTGPFRHSAGDWGITTGDPGTNDDPFDRPYLARGFGRRSDATQLPTAQNQADALAETFYSQFVFELEVVLHNLVHRWVNGQMIWRASPMDPVFWLHHCNIDRLWGVWMRGKAPAARYTAAPGDPTFHQPTGTMIFHDPAVGPATPTWPGSYRPVDVIGDHPFDVWYEGDPPVVTLETPSVTFNDVELGRTTYAAVTFRVEAVDTVGFEVLSAVPAPFGLPPALHPPAPVPPGDVAQTGRVWLSFTASALGPVTPITVTVRCIQTGQVFNVPVTANVVPVRTAAAALVADRSGSMAQDAGNGLTKRQKLTQSLGIVAGLARDADQLALVTFDDQHDVPVPIGDALAPGAGGARDQLAATATSPALDPRGLTGIGAGIQLGVGEVAGASADTVALVVVTDGVENVPPFIADVAGSITSRTFAIGIGRPSDVNTAALTAICQGNDGYLLVTGDLAGEELFRLHKYFLQVHAGVTNNQVVTDPAGELTLGATHTLPFTLTGADLDADVAVVCPLPDVIDVVLEAPDGSTIDAASGLATVTPLAGDWLTGLRLSLPVAPGAHAGTWQARLSIDRGKLAAHKQLDTDLDALRDRGAVPYSLAVTARSDLVLTVRARRKEDVAHLTAALDAHGVPFWDDARVVALLTEPDGRQSTVRLDPQGDGRYGGKLAVPEPGLYTARVIAEGSLGGEPFTREQTVSIPTVTGEPSPEATQPDELARGPRLPRRRRAMDLTTGLREARPPQPPPAPKPISAAALARHRHGHHGDVHFPGPDLVAKPEPWEEAAKAKRPAKKAAKATKPTKPTKGTAKKSTGRTRKSGGSGSGHGH